MLAKFFRLTKLEVSRVFKKGRTYKGSNYTFRYLPNRTTHPRFAIIIPKAVVAKATARNRLKRMITESLKDVSLGSIDIAIQVKKLTEEKDIRANLMDGIDKIIVVR